MHKYDTRPRNTLDYLKLFLTTKRWGERDRFVLFTYAPESICPYCQGPMENFNGKNDWADLPGFSAAVCLDAPKEYRNQKHGPHPAERWCWPASLEAEVAIDAAKTSIPISKIIGGAIISTAAGHSNWIKLQKSRGHNA